MEKFEGLIIPTGATQNLDAGIITQSRLCNKVFSFSGCEDIYCEDCVLSYDNKDQYNDFLDSEGIML